MADVHPDVGPFVAPDLLVLCGEEVGIDVEVGGAARDVEGRGERDRLARVEHLEQMADQSEVSKNGFLEKKAQDRSAKKQKQPTLEEQQAQALAAAMNLHNQPPVVPYVRPKMTSSGPQTTVSGPKRVWREDSGDGYAETIQNHWQEA